MTEFRPWRDIARAICQPPGPHDLCVVLLINGNRVNFRPVSEYDKMRHAAEQLAWDYNWQVKLLPMTGKELLNFYGIEPSSQQPMEALDPAFRAQAVRNFIDVLRTSYEPRECDEALEMLQKLGALHV